MNYYELLSDVLSEISIISDNHEKVDYWISLLTSEGYECNKYAKELLDVLGGICLRGKGKISPITLELNFDPVYFASGEYDRTIKYNKIANDSLFPIGGLYDYTIYIGNKGKFYIADWKSLYECGNTINSFLENILSTNPNVSELYSDSI